MAGVKIKLCGITRAEDARIASELGADFIGMVLHAPSRRRIDLTRAREIVAAAGSSVTPVGLFVDATIEQVRASTGELGITHVQLHGSESPEYVAALTGLNVLKAISIQRIAALEAWRRVPNLIALLLDSGSEGGSGVENDWKAIGLLQDEGRFKDYPPLIVAGGLGPENVGPVVARLKPWGVDVSSGIEESAGIKSRDKMERFVRAARGSASETS